MRCHIPIDELRRLQGKETRHRVKIRGVVLEKTGGPLVVSELDLAPPGAGEVLVRLRASGRLPLGLERRRRHGRDTVPGRARTRGRRSGRGHRPWRRARLGRRPRRTVVGAVVRRVRRVPPRPSAALLHGLAGNGDRWADGRHAAPVARRRAGLPLLLPLDVRGCVRRAGALVHPDPIDVPFDVAALVGCAVTTGSALCGAPRECVRAIASR